MRIEFFNWQCGHHQDCPEPIEIKCEDDNEDEDGAIMIAEKILSAIAAAISQPGSAQAYLINSSDDRLAYYLSDDCIQADAEWIPGGYDWEPQRTEKSGC